MSDQSPANLRGFLHPWPLTIDEVWPAQATYTEQSTLAGAADANSASNLVLTTSGTQDNETDITVTTAIGGTPGAENGATFTWRPTAGSDEYGWDNAGSVTAWERIRWADSGPRSYELPDLIVLDDGTSIIAAQFNDLLEKKLVIYRRAVSDIAWTQITIRTEIISLYSTDFHPGICQLPNQDLLVFAWNDLDNSTVQLDAYVSQDLGASWALLNGGALDAVISTSGSGYTPGRIRAAANNDQVLIFARRVNNTAAAAVREHMIQLASSNLGASFVTVSTSSSQLFGYPDLFVDQNGKFRVASIISSNRIAIWTLPHAFYDLSARGTYAAQVNIINGIVPAIFATNIITDGGLSIWQDPDGSMYSCQKDCTNNIWYLATSRDQGESWKFFQNISSGSTSPYPIVDTDIATTQINHPVGATCRGHQLLVHEHLSTSTSFDKSLSALQLGGYTDRTMPGLVLYPTRLQRVGFNKTWLPFDLPQNTGLFTSSGSGVTESITSGWLDLLDTGGGGSITYEATPAGTIAQGLVVRARLTDKQGAGSDHRDIRTRLADGTNNFDLSVRIYRDNIVMWDNTAGAEITAIAQVGIGSTNSVSILIFHYGATAYVYAMQDEGTTASTKPRDLRNFTAMTGSVSDAGAGTSGNLLQFGHLSVAGATLQTYWHELLYAAGANTGEPITALAYTNGKPISAREYPPIGFYAWVDGGMSISTKDGPGFKGESYRIRKSSKYPITNIFFNSSPSPRVLWRSIGVANPVTTNISEQFIPFQLDTSIGTTQESLLGNDTIALHLEGINFKTSSLEMWNGAAWISKATINSSDQLSNTFVRRGATISYGLTGVTDFYLFHNEAKNWRVYLDDGGGGGVWRQVEWNTEGIFGNVATGKKAVLKIRDGETTDPTHGTIFLCPENLTVIINMLGVAGAAWGLRIPAQKTLEGDARIGHLSFGSMLINAPQYSRGRTLSYTPNVELYQQPDNVIRPHSRSPGRRILSVSWSEGVDTRNFYADALTTMDYWMASDTSLAEPVANVGDIAEQMEGFWRYLNEGEHTTVYCPKIKYASSPALDVQILNRRHNQILCYPSGEINYENVLGNEMENEVFRVSSVTFNEIV